MDNLNINRPEVFNYSPKTTQSKSVKVLAILIAVLIVVSIAVIFWYFQNSREVETEKVSKISDGPNITINQVSTDKLPAQFPADIPIEKDAKILQNYNATAEDGRFQATRVFETDKTLQENFTLYQKYFTNNGWQITNSINQESLKIISAQKKNISAQIVIRQNNASAPRMVSINFTKVPIPQPVP